MKKETLLNVLFVATIVVAIAMAFIPSHVSWFMLPIVPLLYLALTRKWAELGFTRKNLLRALLAGVVVGATFGMARYGIVRLSPDSWVTPHYAQQAHEYYSMVFESGYPVLLLILLFIPIATFEQIFYRGYLQTQFANRLTNWTKSKAANVSMAIGLSSLLYAIWLASMIGPMAIPLFFTSCAAGYLFYRYGNILAPDAVVAVEFVVAIYFIVRAGLV
jgi:membrane protease YdiL (CAAX protease family)